MSRGIWIALVTSCSAAPAIQTPAPPSGPPPPPASVSTATPRAAPIEPAADLSSCGTVPPDMACVPEGIFVRGRDDDPHRCVQTGQPAERVSAAQPAMQVELSAYLIDRTEVTVAAYRRCVAQGACADVRPIYPDFDAPDQPMTGVSWYEADAFCRAQDKRLPTEAEWERAARGPEGDLTSFGDAPVTCVQAVIRDDRGRSCGTPKAAGDPDTGKVLPVGSRPAGHHGLFDMMGNAEEWVADWWTPSYTACGDACQGRDPRGPCGGGGEPCPRHSFKVVRGGSWYWEAEHATAIHRRRHFPHNRRPGYHHFGFRCARSVETDPE